jgi:hypothetical protein
MPQDGDAGWIDEAIAHWVESGCLSYDQAPDYLNAHIGATSPYRRATDLRSRSLGPLVLGHLDFLLREDSGGASGLVEVLKRFAEAKPMTLVTSLDFRDFITMAHPNAKADIVRIFADYIL